MSCSCKHNMDSIRREQERIALFRELFIKRMTVDSETQDRRRKDFNQAIFSYESKEDVDDWNERCAEFGLPPKEYGRTYQVFYGMDMDMVLQCFDDAVKDLRRTWCDTESCNRK